MLRFLSKRRYMKEVCDIDKPHTTTCFECHYGTYTDLPNLRESCMPHVRCDYTKHMVVKIPGSRIRDYVCECEPGYYELNSGLCKPWTKCPKGSGVVKPGDSQHDLECRVCPNGTFANEFDRIAECLPHRNCESEGLVTVKNGTNSEDAVCEAPSTTTVSAGIYSLTLVPSYQIDVYI
ncbi:tumor necrosis factor receptor superfamily member 11B-like [Ptychodera flava]|uniref:tumor necrosis factor receptor superfamily member 11B-like n=1 Tax=Ptychodera flava TaxID=63121 RepID=UPI00396A0BF0